MPLRIVSSRSAFFFWTLFVLCLVPCALPAQVATRVVPVHIPAQRAIGVVNLPKGTTAITLQSSNGRGGWSDIETMVAQPGRKALRLPSDWPRKRFRVVATLDLPSRTRFPRAFYRGANTFRPGQLVGMDEPSVEYRTLVSPTVAMADPVAVEQPAEADIWKISGTTAYFFNQLRGLQVLDLARPEDPALVATLRLPAVGQDLYLLPSGDGFQDVLLIAAEPGVPGAESGTRLLVVRVEGGEARVLHTAGFAGSAADSRLLGRRLFLCVNRGPRTLVSDWSIPEDSAPVKGAEAELAGGFGTLAAGADWLAVAMTPPNDWSRSEVSVFRLKADGFEPLTAGPVAAGGRLNDAHKLQWSDGVLTTIAQRWDSWEAGGIVTRLETFQADGPGAAGERLGVLELARGETLHATRFAGDKAYVVTFFQKDPLFVIDLSDPAAPKVAGQLDVPGWSTHLEPVGDLLFSVGWEDGAVMASLFDVSDPAAPAILRRLALTEGHGYSEANWDPQALKVLPEAGLALVPVSAYGWGGASAAQGVRLIDLDLEARDLSLRGLIPGRFEARRSALVGDKVVTLSQRTLVTAAITDRDQPEVLSDRLLAWPADHVHAAAGKLLQVETGGAWAEGMPTVRTTSLAAPDAVTAELDLPAGHVHDSVLRDGRLYVLRESAAATKARIAYFWTPPLGRLHLDVYDAGDPDALRLLGSCSVDVGASGANRVSRLLWPRAERPVVVLESQSPGWWGYPFVITPPPGGVEPGPFNLVMPAIAFDSPIPRRGLPGGTRPNLLAFDVTDAANPQAGAPTPLFSERAILGGFKAAANGLVVVGAEEWNEFTPVKPGPKKRGLGNYLQIVDVPVAGEPATRSAIDLPGVLFAVSDPEPDGFLAYTRGARPQGGEGFQVSACDGRDAFLVATVAAPSDGAATATGNTLFCAIPDGIARFDLTSAGRLEGGAPIRLGWMPAAVRVADGHVLGGNWRNLAFAPLDGAEPVRSTVVPVGFALERVAPAGGGAWVVPCGDHGVETIPAPPRAGRAGSVE